MNQSENINELVSALSKAQGKMKPAVFNKVNPHYKNRYADFTAVMDACRIPLSENGLSVMQYCETMGEKLVLVTMLAHTSGQWIKSFFPMSTAQNTSQAIGAAMTYGKRYSLSSMLGIVADDDDDDGEVALKEETKKAEKPIVKVSNQQVSELTKRESRLDEDAKKKMRARLKASYKSERFEDIPAEAFLTVYQAYENALKLLEQNHLEAAHA